MHLLSASAEPCVLILCDIELNFEVTVHILDLFSLLLLEWVRLVGLGQGLITSRRTLVLFKSLLVADQARSDSASCRLASLWKRRAQASAAEQNIAGAIVVNNLLDYLAAIAFARAHLGVAGSIHWFYRNETGL